MSDFVRSGGITMGNAVIEVKADSDGNPTECCNPVTGVCLGGGGESDFSTAKVTTVWTDEEEQTVLVIPCGITQEGVSATVINEITSEGSGTVFDVPLYKGLCVIEVTVEENEEIITTGDITFEDGVLYIRGDGTITVSGTR